MRYWPFLVMKKGGNIQPNLAREYVYLLYVRLISTEPAEVLARVRNFISHNRKFYIVTPNPELVLAAESDVKLMESLNRADLAIPDGIGLSYASRFLYGKPLNIIPGRNLFLDLIKLANKKGWEVFFLGGKNDEAKVAAEKLGLSYKKVKIEAFAGPILDNNANPVTEVDRKLYFDAFERINKFKPQLLFVAFGNPKQEKWIHKNLDKLDIGGAMAVGGTFRYVAGYSKLPPALLASLGLEWLWRLLTEPWRAGRILNAMVMFPLRVFQEKLKSMLES